MSFRKTIIAAALMAAPASFGQLLPPPPAPTSSGEIAWYSTGRVGFNPLNGTVTTFSYFTVINGISGSLFNGAPGEATAYFTQRQSFQAFPVPADLDQNIFISGPALIDIYYDPNPKRNWNDPNSFTTGTKVATYARGAFQGEQQYITQYQQSPTRLQSSTPFTFSGQTIDFAKIAPGTTLQDYLGVIPGTPLSPLYPVVWSISTYATATHVGVTPPKTAAVAGPANASVVTSEFRLDASRSTSADGLLKYEWTLAPGSPVADILEGDTANPLVRFAGTGNYTFRLRVSDSSGNSSADFTTVKFVGR